MGSFYTKSQHTIEARKALSLEKPELALVKPRANWITPKEAVANADRLSALQRKARGSIPTELIIPMIDEYCSSRELDYRSFAHQCGLEASVLHKIMNGKKTSISFDTADAIVCKATGNPWRVWREELGEYYEPGAVAADKLRPIPVMV